MAILHRSGSGRLLELKAPARVISCLCPRMSPLRLAPSCLHVCPSALRPLLTPSLLTNHSYHHYHHHSPHQLAARTRPVPAKRPPPRCSFYRLGSLAIRLDSIRDSRSRPQSFSVAARRLLVLVCAKKGPRPRPPPSQPSRQSTTPTAAEGLCSLAATPRRPSIHVVGYFLLLARIASSRVRRQRATNGTYVLLSTRSQRPPPSRHVPLACSCRAQRVHSSTASLPQARTPNPYSGCEHHCAPVCTSHRHPHSGLPSPSVLSQAYITSSSRGFETDSAACCYALRDPC
jgi:hypothetical protein